MSYRSGKSASFNDIVEQVHGFAVSLGWGVAFTSKNTGTLIITPPDGSAFYSLKASTGAGTEGDLFGNSSSLPGIPSNQGIYLLGAKNHNPASSWQDQPNSSIDTRMTQAMSLLAAPTDYWLFGTSTYIHLVVANVAARLYAHALMGTLDKKGMQYPAGQYISGGGGQASGRWAFNTGNNRRDAICTGGAEGRALWAAAMPPTNPAYHHPDNPLIAGSANEMTGDTVLNPARVLTFDVVGGRRRYMGDIPDFAVIRMQNCAPRDILTLATEEWQVFPVNRLGRDREIGGNGQPTNNREETGSFAYAYRIRR